MANEIKLTVDMSVINGTFTDQFRPATIAIDQGAIGRGGYVQIIDNALETAINFGDISTNGYCVLRNLDEDNYVIWGPDWSSALITLGKLNPGEIAVFRVAPGVAIWALADTAPVKLDVRIYED